MDDRTAPRSPAQIYEEAFVPGMFGPLAEIVVALAAPRPDARVLDLGCGTGIVARMIAPLLEGAGSVVGVDIRPGMIDVARETSAGHPASPRIDYRVGDATSLDIPDDAFDLVIVQQGLQFFDPRTAAIREIVRVLRPGGRLVAAVWRPLDEQPLWQPMVEIEVRHLGPLGLTWEDAAMPFLWGDADSIRDALGDEGFVDARVERRTFESAFASDTFVADVELAYTAVFPAFVEDPAAHARFVAAVERDMSPVLGRFRDGQLLRAPLATNLVFARVSG